MLKLSEVSLNGRLTNVSCEARHGRFIHLIGANGAGKSSLLSVVSGLIGADKGAVICGGRDINDYDPQELARFRSYQRQQQDTQFSLTVKEAFSFFSTQTDIPDALECALEIRQFVERDMQTLSGGEKKRVHLARIILQVWSAIQQGNALVLLDEPIQELDFRHQHLLFGFLKTLASRGNLVIASHHDLNLCWQYADDVWMMQNAELVHQGKCRDVMTTGNLEAVFDCRVNSVFYENNNTLFQTFIDN